MRAAHIADMDDAIASPRPLLQFALRNLGRAVRYLEETGWLLTQRAAAIRLGNITLARR